MKKQRLMWPAFWVMVGLTLTLVAAGVRYCLKIQNAIPDILTNYAKGILEPENVGGLLHACVDAVYVLLAVQVLFAIGWCLTGIKMGEARSLRAHAVDREPAKP